MATGLVPLSVSADRIGHTAMRCAALQAALAALARAVALGRDTVPDRDVARSEGWIALPAGPLGSLLR